MTSAARTTTDFRSGFTLLEIVMVLAISGMILAGAAGLMVYSSEERTLRDFSGQIELLAKRARTMAVLKQTPYALEIREGIVRMLPFAEAGIQEKKMPGKQDLAESVDEDQQVNLRDGMEISILRWNSEKWLTTLKNTVHVWRFDPDGLCEPVSIRLNLNQSWCEDTYHPLTGSVRHSELEAR